MTVFRDVPDHMWVKLAQPAKSFNVERNAGDTCSLMKGGSVEIIGNDDKFGTLARYRTPYGKVAAGALCPSDALIFLPTEVVATWPELGTVQAKILDEADERNSVVEKLLGRQ